MKFTMRDKICKLIGKYNELEQQAMVNVAGGAFRTMLGKMPTKEEENASEKASIYHWMQEDLKQLLEEDEAPCRPPQDRPGGQVVRGLSGTGSCGYRDQEVAKYIGIGRDTMSGRMQGHNPWTSAEITAMCELLDIRQEEIGELFFPSLEKGESA